MSFLNLLGMVGGFLGSFGMVFQVHKTLRDRAIQDISMSMLGANIIGIIMVMIYSIGTSQPSIYIPLCLSFLCNIILVTYKVKVQYAFQSSGILSQTPRSDDIALTEK